MKRLAPNVSRQKAKRAACSPLDDDIDKLLADSVIPSTTPSLSPPLQSNNDKPPMKFAAKIEPGMEIKKRLASLSPPGSITVKSEPEPNSIDKDVIATPVKHNLSTTPVSEPIPQTLFAIEPNKAPIKIDTTRKLSFPKQQVPLKDIVFSDKHSPKSSAELIGNSRGLGDLKKWLTNFKAKVPGTAPAVLLSGPPGIGKTTVAHIILREFGFKPVEFNASEVRTKNALAEQLLPIMMIDSSFFNKSQMVGVVLDEIDGMTGDNAGISTVVSLLKAEYTKVEGKPTKSDDSRLDKHKLTQLNVSVVEKKIATKKLAPTKGKGPGKPVPKSNIPVICIANDVYSKKMISLKSICQEIKFFPPSQADQAALVERILRAEGFAFDAGVPMLYAQRMDSCDLRHLTLELGDFLRFREKQSIKHITKDDVNSMHVVTLDTTDSQSPFAAAIRLLKGGQDVESSLVTLSVDPGKITQMIMQNYPEFMPTVLKQRQTPKQISQAEAAVVSLLSEQADLYSEVDLMQRGKMGDVQLAFGTSVHGAKKSPPNTFRPQSQSLVPLAYQDFASNLAVQKQKRLSLSFRSAVPRYDMHLLRFRLPTQDFFKKTAESKAKLGEFLQFADLYNVEFDHVEKLMALTTLASMKNSQTKLSTGGKVNGLKGLMNSTSPDLADVEEEESDNES